MSDNSKKSALRWPSANGAMGLGFSSFKASDLVGFHHYALLFFFFLFVFYLRTVLVFVSACHSLMNAMKARSSTIPGQTPTFNQNTQQMKEM